MAGQLVGQVDSLVSSPLWHHDDAADLLHLGVVWWTGSIQVAGNLDRQRKSLRMCGRQLNSEPLVHTPEISEPKIEFFNPAVVPFSPALADLRCK